MALRVPEAGLLSQKAWEVGGLRVQHADQVVPVEILTTQSTDLVNIEHLKM